MSRRLLRESLPSGELNDKDMALPKTVQIGICGGRRWGGGRAGIKGRSEAEIKSTRGIVMKDEVREVSKMQLIGGIEVMLRNGDFILSLLGNQAKN